LTALKGVPAAGGSIPKISGTGESMVRNEPGQGQAQKCIACGQRLTPAAVETFGQFCSVDCLNRKLVAQ
jgi:hypothetical protein